MRRILLAACLLFMGMVSVAGCSGKTGAVYKKITAAEAARMMRENEGYILLDVRTKEEFDAAHIEGAVLLPNYEVKDRAGDVLPDKNALILIYCRSGRRSADAAKKLIEMGFMNVYDFGGIIDWPYETIRG